MGTKHTAEFKQEVVRVALNSGLTQKKLHFTLDFAASYCRKYLNQRQKVAPYLGQNLSG